jgi:hypothetical protein
MQKKQPAYMQKRKQSECMRKEISKQEAGHTDVSLVADGWRGYEDGSRNCRTM